MKASVGFICICACSVNLATSQVLFGQIQADITFKESLPSSAVERKIPITSVATSTQTTLKVGFKPTATSQSGPDLDYTELPSFVLFSSGPTTTPTAKVDGNGAASRQASSLRWALVFLLAHALGAWW